MRTLSQNNFYLLGEVLNLKWVLAASKLLQGSDFEFLYLIVLKVNGILDIAGSEDLNGALEKMPS